MNKQHTIVKTKNVMTSQHIPAQLMVRRNLNTEYEPEHPDLSSVAVKPLPSGGGYKAT